MERVLLFETVMDASVNNNAVLPPTVKLGGTVKEAPIISRADEPVIVKTPGNCKKYEGFVFWNLKDPPATLTRLPTASVPETIMCVDVAIPACVVPFTMVTSKGLVYNPTVAGQATVSVPAN